MKKIINGKLYDTDTATEIGSNYYGTPGDFSYFSEHLYKKRTGEFFLHGSGGPMSRYSKSIGQNEWSGSEKIIPMSYESAREWAEKNLDADDFQQVFGEITEGEDAYISVKLPAAADSKLRRMAAEQGLSLTAMIIKLISEA